MQSSAQRILKHSTVYAAANVIRQLAGFIMLPIYTRYMSPSDYGVVGLLTFAMALIEPLFGARLGAAMTRFYYEEVKCRPGNESRVISTALIVTASVSAVSSLGIFYLQRPAANALFGSPAYSMLVGIFGFQILTQALEYYGLTYIRIQERPYLFLSMSMTKLAVQLALNIYFVVHLELAVAGVVYGTAISSTIYAIGLTIYMIKRCGAAFDREMASKMLVFNTPLWLAGLAGLYIFSANRIYIRVFSSIDDVGLYELATRFATVLMVLIWQPFALFWETERFRLFHTDDPASSFRVVFAAISSILVIAGTGISIFAEPTIQVMSEPSFHAASASVPLLVAANLFSCLNLFFSFSFLASDQTGALSRNSLIGVVIVTLLNVLLIPGLGAQGAAASLAITNCLQFLLIYEKSKRHFDMGVSLRPLWMIVIAAAAVVLIAQNYTFGDALIYQVGAKLALYVIFAAAVIVYTSRTAAPGLIRRVQALRGTKR